MPLHACVPLGCFGPWPPGLPLQIHVMENDRLGNVEVAREVAAAVDTAELFLHPGDRHLFTDCGLDQHDPDAAALLMRRVLAFLQRLA